MKKITRISLFLLLISTPITNAHFFDTYTDWMRNIDLGLYKAPLMAVTGVIGFGYFFYRDIQQSNKIMELEKKIRQKPSTVATTQSIPQEISKLPKQNILINKSLQNLESRVGRLEGITSHSEDVVELRESISDAQTKISPITFQTLFSALEDENNAIKATGIALKNMSIMLDELKTQQVQIAEDIKFLKAARTSDEMNFKIVQDMQNHISEQLKKQLYTFPENINSNHAKTLHVLSKSVQHMDIMAQQILAIESLIQKK